MTNYSSVLTLLLRMRQACDHPSLVTASLTIDKDAIDLKPATANDEPDVEEAADDLADLLGGLGVDGSESKVPKCGICLTPLENKEGGDPTEKNCRDCAALGKLAREQSVDSVAMDEDGKGNGLPPCSAKIRKMVELLANVREKSDGKEKTIVFSQVSGWLTLVMKLDRADTVFVANAGSSPLLSIFSNHS